MENRYVKLYTSNTAVPLKVVAGHFATNHSHINYYIDMTTIKTRQAEAQAAAKALVGQYMYNTVVDTIVCLDGTEVIGAFLAEELSKSGFMNRNEHHTIYVVPPEYDVNGQMLFRDNIQPMIAGKCIIVLMASITTGMTVNRSIECIQYYGGQLQGVSAIFSAVDQVDDILINSVFSKKEIPDYQTYDHHDCPFCKKGIKLEALVNSYGYSKL